jgi:hypothetical protein
MDCRACLEALSCFHGKPPALGGFLSSFHSRLGIDLEELPSPCRSKLT